MPLASLRCRSDRFDDERLNQKVKIATLKNYSVDFMTCTSFCYNFSTVAKPAVAYLSDAATESIAVTV